MSRNDIFSTSFAIEPPTALAHITPLTPALPTDPSSSNSTLNRARTTGQSWLRTRALRDRDSSRPPPLQLGGLQRNRSVQIAQKPYVYILPDPPLSPPNSGYGNTAEMQEPDGLSLDTLATEPFTPQVSTTHALPQPPNSEPGPSRTTSFFDLPAARVDPPTHVSKALTSSSSDFSSAYSTRSNPGHIEELPWEGRAHGADDVDELEEVRLRLTEDRRFFLGEGRFAKVWVAAYKKPRRGGEDEELGEGTPVPHAQTGRWRLCAAKQPLADAESQLLGRREAFFLRHLRKPNLASISDQLQFADGRKHIVRLLGIFRASSGSSVHSVPPPLPLTLPPADGADYLKRPSLHHLASSQLTAHPISPPSAVTPQAVAKPDPFHLAPPTPQSLRHARSVSDTLTSSLLSPTPHAPRPRSRANSPVRNWLSLLPPSPPSPATHPAPDPASPPTPPITLLLSYHPSGSLASLLHRAPHLLTPQLYTQLAHQLALAVAYVHSCSVLHTDIKPQNVLLSTPSHGHAYSARLADFGSALLLPPYSAPPSDGLGLGTPGYTAPELLLPPGSGTFSYSADVFSLGVVLGVLLFGREPYSGLVGRGRGRLEMMRWARRGEYWAYEEGVRLARVGEHADDAAEGRDDADEEDDAPGMLGREELDELLRDDDGDEGEDDPWTAYPRDGAEHAESLAHAAADPVPVGSAAREPIPLPSPPNSPPRASQFPPAHAHAPIFTRLPPPPPPPPQLPSAAPYPDGSPPIFFLGPGPSGQMERAPDELVGLVRRMCTPRPAVRPGMEEVVRVLGALREMYEGRS